MKTLLIALCLTGCSASSTLHNTDFATTDQVWVIQRQQDQNDTIVYCNARMNPAKRTIDELP